MLTPRSSQSTFNTNYLNSVRGHMAEHLIGNTVDLLTRSKTILHGIVTGVLTEAGKPKVVVNGRRYDINQIVTVQPSSFN